jgi:hypothetical protein
MDETEKTMTISETPVQRTLSRWHAMVEAQDFTDLHELLAVHPIFRSPIAHSPYTGEAVFCMILSAALGTFSEFKYERSFVNDANNIALEFSAKVDGMSVKGIDLIRFSTEGNIEEFEVMLRPLAATTLFADHMKAKVGPYLKSLKIITENL